MSTLNELRERFAKAAPRAHTDLGQPLRDLIPEITKKVLKEWPIEICAVPPPFINKTCMRCDGIPRKTATANSCPECRGEGNQDIHLSSPPRLFTNTSNGHRKFYAVARYGRTTVYFWGKIGTKGQNKVETFDTENEARTAKRKIIGEKVAGGYKERRMY